MNGLIRRAHLVARNLSDRPHRFLKLTKSECSARSERLFEHRRAESDKDFSSLLFAVEDLRYHLESFESKDAAEE